MEKPVKEDFNLGWPVIRAMMIGVMGLLLLAGWKAHDPKGLLFVGGALIFFYFVARPRKRAADSASTPDTWLITDAGLQRVYSDPVGRELISWKSIQSMRWIRFKGLLFLWNESGQRCESFRNEFKEGDLAGLYRGVLRVRQNDADEIAECWLARRKPADREITPRPARHRARRPLSRKANQTIVVSMVVGLALLVFGAAIVLRHSASATWPSAPGKIVFQGYRAVQDSDRSSDQAKLHLTYRYIAGGEEYLASQYSLGQADYVNAADDVRAMANAYPTGTVVQVHYNPKDPAQAVLHAGPDWRDDGAFLVLGSLLVFITLMIRTIMQSEASRRERPENNWFLKVYGAGPK